MEVSSEILHSKLKDFFGFSSFKGDQEAIIKHLMGGNDAFVLHIQVTQCRHRQKPGVFHHHLVILHHIKKCHDQLVVRHRDDVVQVLAYVWENLLPWGLYRRTVSDGAYPGHCGYFACL